MKQIASSILKLFYKPIKALFIALLILQSMNTYAGVLVTVPSTPGTDTTSLLPTNRRYNYSAARMIYTATEIGSTGTITKIAFQKDAGATTTSVNYISIYLRETTSSTSSGSLPSTFPSGYTKVYNSSYIDNTMTSGWTTITLSTATSDIFTFSGGSNNLEVVLIKTTSESGTSNYPIYNCHTTSSAMSSYYYNNSSAMSTTFTGTTTTRPNIQLTFENSCSGKPLKGTITAPVAAVCSDSNFTLNTTGLTIASGMKYQWQWRNAGSGAYINTSSADTNTTLTTSINANKDFRIYSVCVLSGQSDTSDAITVNKMDVSAITALSDTVFCSGDSVQLQGSSSSGVSYLWYKDAVSTGVSGITFNAKASGTYTLKSYTASCSGVWSNSKTVTVNAMPDTTLSLSGSTTFCDGDSVILSVSSGYQYQWQKASVDIYGATSRQYTAKTSGNYRVKITNSTTGCTIYSRTISVTVNAMPMKPIISGAGSKTAFCDDDSLLISTVPTYGVSYQWYDASGAIVGANSNSYKTWLSDTYVLEARIGSCAINSDSLKITNNPLPSVAISPSGTISFCNGDSVWVKVPSGSSISYQWQESTVDISGATNDSLNVKTAGVYRVLAVNTVTGCKDTSTDLSVTIISPTLPTISASGATTFCFGDTVLLNAAVAGGLTTQWQKDGSDILGAASISYKAYQSGDYRMKVTNGFGCKAHSAVIKVTVNALPDSSITVTGATTICFGDKTLLNAVLVAGSHYQWYESGSPLAADTMAVYKAVGPGVYHVKIVDSNACTSSSDPITINVNYVAPFTIIPHGNTYFCDGDKTKLSTQGGFSSYQWYYNGVFIPGASDTFVYADKNGKYTVKVQDPVNGCFADAKPFNIIVIAAPDTPFITQIGSRLSTSVKDVSYQWYKNSIAIPGATDSFIIMSGPAVYSVKVTNDLDCSKTDSIDLSSTSITHMGTSKFFIKVYPNPSNGIVHIESPELLSVKLYDMQGKLLLETQTIQDINLSNFANGLYLLKFYDLQGLPVAAQKIMKAD